MCGVYVVCVCNVCGVVCVCCVSVTCVWGVWGGVRGVCVVCVVCVFGVVWCVCVGGLCTWCVCVIIDTPTELEPVGEDERPCTFLGSEFDLLSRQVVEGKGRPHNFLFNK